ncbi:hypothetical protein PAXINDRAFT_100049 [Paxillus involutus ATCC 200175]|uniref:RING-type domain-containing protein n=1 Tax=Paxillus involutus ATCC 200175 TaxID=664439 RepID=A0A0C9TFY9_PAXIN|nr:hypothetical protein PAXINDRAFT_100049 [Paxillus involutus ATCC 200175]
MFECRYCGSADFASDEARLEHESAKHLLCRACHKAFKLPESCQQHEQAKHNLTLLQCSRCGSKFQTIHERHAHEKSHRFPYITVVSSPSAAQPQPVSSYSSSPSLFSPSINSKPNPVSDTQGQRVASPAAPLYCHTEMDELPCDPSELQTSDEETSSVDEKHVLNSNDDSPSIAGPRDVPASPCSSSTCDDDKSDDGQDDAGNIISGGGGSQDGPAEDLQATCHCISCSQVFDTDEDLRGHFDGEPSRLKHLEDRMSFRCYLCQTLCCSNDMLQDHLLDHPTCRRCGRVFIDDLALCNHVGSEHPVVVCWDCDGAVVEQDSLELHYAVSPEHPSCRFCGVGQRHSDGMEEHIKNRHAAELHDSIPNDIEVIQLDGQVAIDGGSNATGDEESAQAEKQLATEKRDGLGQDVPAESEPTSTEEAPTANNEALREPSTSPLRTELPLQVSLTPSCIPPSSPQEVDTSSTSDTVRPTSYSHVSPSPIPSEHGSNGNPWWLLTHHSPVDVVKTSGTRPASPRSSASTETLYYDLSARSSPLSSSHAIVDGSANETPEYVSANRTYFASGPGSVQLPSYSSLGSLEPGPAFHQDVTLITNVAGPSTSTATTQRLHCRICLRDPCEEMTATICGHIFCKRCITQAVVAKSECPACKSATLLYCLFKLDLSV